MLDMVRRGSCARRRTSRSRGAAGSPEPSRRDHRPGRPQDDDQRAQLGRQGLHGRLRGRELADVGQRARRPAERLRRSPPADRARHAREELPPERRDRDARDSQSRLAHGRAAPRGRRRAGVRVALRLRPDVFNNAHEQLARGTGPYFYLPKLESHEEARLWARAFGSRRTSSGWRTARSSARC